MSDEDKSNQIVDALVNRATKSAVLKKFEVGLRSILDKIANDSLKREKFYKNQLDKIFAIVCHHESRSDLIPSADKAFYELCKDITSVFSEAIDDDAGHDNSSGAVDNAE